MIGGFANGRGEFSTDVGKTWAPNRIIDMTCTEAKP